MHGITSADGSGLLGRVDLRPPHPRLPKPHRPTQNLGLAHHQRPAPLVNDGFAPCADDDLRSDPGRIAHRHGNQRFRILHSSALRAWASRPLWNDRGQTSACCSRYVTLLTHVTPTDCTPPLASSQRAVVGKQQILILKGKIRRTIVTDHVRKNASPRGQRLNVRSLALALIPSPFSCEPAFNESVGGGHAWPAKSAAASARACWCCWAWRRTIREADARWLAQKDRRPADF